MPNDSKNFALNGTAIYFLLNQKKIISTPPNVITFQENKTNIKREEKKEQFREH